MDAFGEGASVPIKSKAQWGYLFANHPEMAHEWAHHTSKAFKALPEHVDDKKKKHEKKGFSLMDLLSGLAKQAADSALVEKLAADTRVGPDAIVRLAELSQMPVSRFVKLAYRNPGDYVGFLQLVSGAVPYEKLAAHRRTGPLVKRALGTDLLGKIKSLLSRGGAAVHDTTLGRAYRGATGTSLPHEMGGVLGQSPSNMGALGRLLEDTRFGKSTAGRAGTLGTIGTGVGAAGVTANEAIPGHRFSGPPAGPGGATPAATPSNPAGVFFNDTSPHLMFIDGAYNQPTLYYSIKRWGSCNTC
jgi:hypothetical protein